MIPINKEKFYITTAIPYVNADPHIGHTLEFIQTDVIKRFWVSRGRNAFLVCGADENSLKNVQAAEKLGISPQELCDRNALRFKELKDKIGYSYDVLVKSSSKTEHVPGVHKLWGLCNQAGDIYKKKYKGLYCVGCEVFYTENELTHDGLCPEHLKKPDLVEEENYFFRLSKYQSKLQTLIETDQLKIYPESRKNEMLAFVRQGLEDFSVSRSVKRARGWGIPVPDDPSQIIYVWFDALACYLTGVGYGKDEKLFAKWWPPDTQVIGKGIIKFHAIYWPAMLMSAGLTLPKRLFVHGYITVEGQKMSKSLGNVLDPFKLIDRYGADQLRYYLMAEIPVFLDGDFSSKGLVERINNELVANLGNLVNRTLVFIQNNFGSTIGSSGKIVDSDANFIYEQQKLIDKITELLERYELTEALHAIMSFGKNANKYFQDNKPWELVKADKERAKTVLQILANQIVDLAILIWPYMPYTSEQIFRMVKLNPEGWQGAGSDHFAKTHNIGKPEILFEKIDLKKFEEESRKKERSVEFEVTKGAQSFGIVAAAAIITPKKISNKSAVLEKLKSNVFELHDELYQKAHKAVGAEEETSVGALHEVVAKGGKLPTINTLVDAYNYVSLKTGISAGAHDISTLLGNVRIDVCTGAESFTPLGAKTAVKARKGEYAALDDEKVICRLELKQCEQTKVTKYSRQVLLYYQGVKGHTQEQANAALLEACELIKSVCEADYSIIYPKTNMAPSFPSIAFADLDLEVGEIVSVERHPNAEKLYVEKVLLGDGERQIVSGLVAYYLPDELVGKKCIIVKNLAPAKLRGIESQGMLLAAEDKEKRVEVVSPDAPVGTKITLKDGIPAPAAQVTIDQFFKVKLEVRERIVMHEGNHLFAAGKEIRTTKIKDGKVC